MPRRTARRLAGRPRTWWRPDKAARIVREGVEETLTYMAFPTEHRRQIRTNNPLEQIMREIRRRTRVVEAFPTDAQP